MTTICDICFKYIGLKEPVTLCASHGRNCDFLVCDPCAAFQTDDQRGIDFLSWTKRTGNCQMINIAFALIKTEAGEILHNKGKVASFNVSALKDAGLQSLDLIEAVGKSGRTKEAGLQTLLDDLDSDQMLSSFNKVKNKGLKKLTNKFIKFKKRRKGH